jgi:flavin-dependent dehydrogenase
MTKVYDVLICGGGLAGLTLARQLKLELSDLSVAVVDRLARPLPEAAHKVGESTVELASYYFAKVLQLEDHLQQEHLPKLGLRFFFGDAHGPLEERPELGPSLLPPVFSYQIDRGRFENVLRQRVAEMGVDLYEETLVEDVVLAEAEEAAHVVKCRRQTERFHLNGRWLIDALGRRRLLQTKLGLTQPNGHAASAAWWRVDARLDVTEMGDKQDRQWRRRMVEARYLSTVHFMGRGYWVWLIPLASGATSVGIVTDETIHPVSSYGKSHADALAWLRQYEPLLWTHMREHNPLDSHSLKHYSYHTQQLFSHRRWSCVGDAGFFLDPLYSLGSDFIAIENTITTELIRRDFAGVLTETAVDQFNRLVLDLLGLCCLDYYKDTYALFGHAHIFTAKFAWDIVIYWALLTPVILQDIVRHPPPELFDLIRRYKTLNERVQQLCLDWAKAAPPRPFHLPYADLTRMQIMQALHLELTTRRSPAQFVEVTWKNLDRLEELAQVLFWQAVTECLPEYLPVNERSRPWLNAWKISLDPERWQEEGLYDSETAPRPLQPMARTYAGIFAPMSWREFLELELPYRLTHLAGGKLYYTLIHPLHRRLVSGKPALWLRRLFVVDYPASKQDRRMA